MILITRDDTCTVEELSEVLKHLVSIGHGNKIIRTEGCDCFGNAQYVDIDDEKNTVFIMRGEDKL